MNLNKIKKLVEKWVKGSQEKQLKVFLKNKKTTSVFQEIINSSPTKI